MLMVTNSFLINQITLYPLGVAINDKFLSLSDLDFARFPVAFYHFIKLLRQAVLSQSLDCIYQAINNNRSGRRWEKFNSFFGCFVVCRPKEKKNIIKSAFKSIQKKILNAFDDFKQLSIFEWWQSLPCIPYQGIQLNIFGGAL